MSDAAGFSDQPAPTGEAMARRLGLAGLVPFVVLAAWLAAIPLDHVWRADTVRLLSTYAAVILSFLGGARWGLAVAGTGRLAARDFALSVLPSLVGWAALFLPPHYGFVLLAVAFAAQGAWDALSGQAGALPLWFARLRTLLTIVVVIAMIVAFAATARG